MTIFCSPIKLRKSGFMVKWQEKPGFGMLNHISHILYIYVCILTRGKLCSLGQKTHFYSLSMFKN